MYGSATGPNRSIQRLGSGQQGHVYSNQDGRPRAPWRTDTHVESSRVVFDRSLYGEKIVVDIQAVGREYRHLPEKDAVDLFARFPDRRCGSDDLRPNGLVFDFPGAKFVDGRFVEPDHGPQGTGDQMKLVLDDQIRRADRRNGLDLDGGQAIPLLG
jgi:hypothetical protein